MDLVDTHCPIQEIIGESGIAGRWHKAGITDGNAVLEAAKEAGVNRCVCVGTTLSDSELAVAFAEARENCWASIGIHPHEAHLHLGKTEKSHFASLLGVGPLTGEENVSGKIVAIGECGLDYFYEYSSKADQAEILKFQIELALEHNLPLIFHIREAFEDFWPIFDQYEGIRGVVHSFSSDGRHLEQILSRGLYVGLNGIMTFTKSQEQLNAAKEVPLDKLLLEKDAPFLTPAPYRGTICEPKHVRLTAEFLAKLRGENLVDFATQTKQNARDMFKF
jgi:TatD DNase family protein